MFSGEVGQVRVNGGIKGNTFSFQENSSFQHLAPVTLELESYPEMAEGSQCWQDPYIK